MSRASPWNSSDQKAAGSAGVSLSAGSAGVSLGVSSGAAIELLEDSATVALLVGVASELPGMTPGTLSGTPPEELLAMVLEELFRNSSATKHPSDPSAELAGCCSAGPALFESEEQEVRIAHAAATVKNGIPNFLNMP